MRGLPFFFNFANCESSNLLISTSQEGHNKKVNKDNNELLQSDYRIGTSHPLDQ